MKALRWLRWLALLLGAAIVVIGALHIVFGMAFIRGATQINASLDSEDRFFGAIFLGYGLAWLWCTADIDARLAHMRFLASVFLLGGMARLVSLALVGVPDPLYVGLTVVELLLPALIFVLCRNAERRVSS